jgi:uncharacterized protein YndB with AHSA1/START domain
MYEHAVSYSGQYAKGDNMSGHMSFVQASVSVKKPRQTVFAALTQADQLLRWFPSHAESDARVGGKIKLTFEFENANENGVQDGRYVEVVPNEKLGYTWLAEPVMTTVTFVLSEHGGETNVGLDHWTDQEGADEKKLHDGHANQWEFFLMNLKGYLEAGMDMRAEKLHQVTH